MPLQVMTVKLPADVVEQVKADAESDDRTPSYTVRKILMQHYASLKSQRAIAE